MNDTAIKVWAKRLGLISTGIVLALIVFNPFSKSKEIDSLTAENEKLTIEKKMLEKDYISLETTHDTLLVDTADWRKLSVGQQKATFDKVMKENEEQEKAKVKAAEKEALAKAEKKAAEEKAKVEAQRIVAEEELKEAETDQILTEEKVKQIITDYSLGENDALTNFSFENGTIIATIELSTNEMFPDEDLVVNMYSGLSDELLEHEGWKVLTITYLNIGTISMNRNEKETNEYGDYFPTMTIENRLSY